MDATGYAITARNGSDEPVYDVQVQVFIRPGRLIEMLWNRLDEAQKPVHSFYVPLLPPQSTEHRWVTRDPDDKGWWFVITFRDSQGLPWQREPNGSLRILMWSSSLTKPRRSVKSRLDAWAKGQMDELDS
jgi:hypothetical protein